MSTQIIRVEGYSKGSLNCIGNECDRKLGVEHRNSDIDVSLSKYNWSFKDTTSGSFYTEYAEIMAQLDVQKPRERKKDIAFEGMLITSDSAFFEGKSPSEIRHFFSESYKWALEQIGYKGTDKNIISAKVHLDEKTPHLHIYYLPVTDKWKEKVYEKDEDGHVVRRGKHNSPVQAKDENGKTIFNDIEDVDHPKLSRTEFWRVRGGKSSYRRMQDDFQEKIGKKYDLERGEVGSDREHESKYQYKMRQLEDQLKPYSDMKIRTDKVDEQARNLPFGKTVVDTKAFEKTKRQAKTYIANREQIRTLKADQLEVERGKVDNESEREKLEKDRAELEAEREQVQEVYRRQLSINQILEQTERKLQDEKEKTSSLTFENGSLKSENAQQSETILELQEANRKAYELLTSVCKAVGMLKYDKEEDYRADLTPQQERLVDGVANYSAYWAKKNGHSDLAEKINGEIGISKGIQAEIDELTPKKTKSRGHNEMSL